mgnify:CR=1 FL=1
MSNTPQLRVAVDIGGTFTDMAAFDEATGKLLFGKALSTHGQLVNGIQATLDSASIDLKDGNLFLHGSTIAINTLLERNGANTALLITEGFRDIYEIGRVNRPDAYNLFFNKHQPLVKRSLRFEVAERLRADGSTHKPLDEAAVRELAKELRGQGIEAVAVLLLHSYRNPAHEQRVKQILQETATNMTGRAAWEAGAGYVNTYAAVKASLGATGYGATVNANRTFNANAKLAVGSSNDYTVNFSPAGPVETVAFEVGNDISLVTARANVGENTVAIVLTDPNGKSYGSSIALPVLGQNIAASAPGVPGTWTLSVRGVGAVSGVDLDPANVTNGYGVPGPVDVTVKTIRTAGFTGLSDIAGNPARAFVEFAVGNRLVDGYADGTFRPDNALTRGELAQYLVGGAGVRQALPGGAASTADVALANPLYPFVESAVARGAALRDLSYRTDGVIGLLGGSFRPDDKVTRVSLAYSLVQSMGLQSQATAFGGELTVLADGKRVAIEDAASIPASLRGYVQLALDQGLINARFTVTQGPFDLEPKLQAYFDPNLGVTRAAYAVAAGRFMTQFKSVED